MASLGVDSRHVREVLESRLGIDARALGALRIALGSLLLVDLLLRAQDLVAHYTDVGVLPRAALRDSFPGFARLSLHTLSGDAWVQALLFLLAGVFAVALLLGYRTRIATVASFVLLVSLHARNPLLLNAGDSLLRRLLLWGMFLPLGGRWSLDALRSRGDGYPEERSERILSVASAALVIQVVLVYLVNGLLKLRGDAWLSGEAVRIVFGLDHLTILLGDVVARYPTLLGALDRVWLAMTLSAVLLVLLPGRARIALVSLFAGAHLGMLLTMRLGIFPLVSIAGLLPFLPRAVWDRVERRVAGGAALGSWTDRLYRRPFGPKQWPNWVGRLGKIRPAVVAVLLAFVLVWNAASLGLVDLPSTVESTIDPADRRWDMFAPEPRSVDGWYVIAGTLENGERVDAFHGGNVSWDRPPDLARAFPSHRWFVYLLDLRRPGASPLREHLADYLCTSWNRGHDTDLAELTITYVAEPVRLGAPDPTRNRTLGEYTCASA